MPILKIGFLCLSYFKGNHVHQKFLGMPFDVPLDKRLLDIENKTRSNSLAWRGQFSPQLVELFLRSYASPGDKVFDPFVGSGTVLCESARMNLCAYGCEINPAAYFFAKFYSLSNIDLEKRLSLFDKLQRNLSDRFFDVIDFFANPASFSENEIKLELVALYKTLTSSLEKMILETLITSLDFFKPGLSQAKVFDRLKYLRALASSFPCSLNSINAFLADARELSFPDNFFDFIVSSPPYINVFNYHQQYRASTEALGWDLISVARSEIGSNRKFRQNRFFTIIQYCLDIAMALNELHRVCKDTAKIIFVIGRESNVKKTPFYNGALFQAIATRACSFNLILSQERVFQNKFGQQIYEDIFHFTKAEQLKFDLSIARSVALEALQEAQSRVPLKEKPDLEQAILLVNDIKPSPIFNYKPALAHINSFSPEFINAPSNTTFRETSICSGK